MTTRRVRRSGRCHQVSLEFDRAITREDVRLPGAEICLLRQLAGGAKAIEHFAVGRTRSEERRVEIPQLLIGRVAEDEVLAAVENRDRGRQLIEGSQLRLHLPLQIDAHRLEFRHVDGDAGAAVAGRLLDHVEHRALTRHDRGNPGRKGRAAAALAVGLFAGRAVEQLDGASRRVGNVRRLDGAQIGLVGPDQRVVPVANPERMSNGIEQARHGAQVAARSGKFRAAKEQIGAIDGHVPQP